MINILWGGQYLYEAMLLMIFDARDFNRRRKRKLRKRRQVFRAGEYIIFGRLAPFFG
jgi:hypothetical protein